MSVISPRRASLRTSLCLLLSALPLAAAGRPSLNAYFQSILSDAAPFDPLPASYKPVTLEVHFHFSMVK